MAFLWWQMVSAYTAGYNFAEKSDQPCCDSCKLQYPRVQSYCLTDYKEQWYYQLTDGSWAEETNYKNIATKYETTVCRATPPEYYRSSSTCKAVKCSSVTCSGGQFQSSSCTLTTDKVCTQCGTCGVGQETQTACGGTSNIVCQSCPSGKYRDNVNTQTACVDCAVCKTSLRQYRQGCTATSNEQCPVCPEGNIVNVGPTTDSCQLCGGGTYARASDNTCATCKTCARTEKQTSACLSTGDRTCAACGDNRYTLAVNADTCAGCIQSYYLTGAGSCALCADSSCGNGNYRTCSFTEAGGGTRTCGACEGQTESGSTKCDAGKGVSTRCEGTGTVAVTCSPCGEGLERPNGTPLVGNIQACVACGLGFFKNVTGVANCGACTNKPGDNTQYVSWGTTSPSANACPWICNAGFLRVGDACVACATGKYSTTAGATVCQSCTNAQNINNTYYLQRVTTIASANNCPWECNAGYIKSGLSTSPVCVSCATGTYRSAAQNVANEGQTNVCYQCTTCILQSLPGTQGTYMAQDCMASSDRVCLSCRTSCASGQYVGAYCNRTSDMQCQPCATTCPAEKYRSATVCSGSTTVDTQLADCRTCLTQCGAGQYLSGTCPGTTTMDRVCLPCSKDLKTCKINEYEGGCGGSMDTRCIPYTVCPTGYYLADESKYRDGVCRQCSTCDGLTVLRPCTSRDDAVCRGAYSCGERADCPRLTASNRSSYFCDYSQGVSLATCGVCPPGYGSDGQYCTECLRGYTCDRVGGPACRGQCGPEYRSECVSEFGLDYARCRVKCELVPGTRKPWRGSFVLAGNEDCATYFLCTPGYYKNFSSGGTVTCEACQASLLPVGAVWVTDGLSVEDDASCLWECQPDLYALSANGLGCVARPNRAGGYLLNEAGSWRGLNGGGVCGIGRTSQAGTAIAPEECLACQPLVPDIMRWKDRTDQCEFECVRSSDTKLGSKCVRERTACSGEGLLLLQGTTCVPQAFPWNSPGYQKKGTEQGVAGWIFSLANGTTGTGATAVVYPLATSVRGGIKNRHTVTGYAGAAARSVEGALCSQTIGWVGGYQYVFGSLCNQSFLVYLNLSSTARGLGVLIGNGTRGWRDGFRTQALFESELYVAGTGNGTLFVLDRWNCLLREVVVWDRPGSYLTRVYTLWGNTDKLVSPVAPEAKCYGSGSLAWPRQWWPLWGDWLAFADEDGLWQFQRETRELLRMMSEADAPVDATLEVDNLRAVGGNASALVLDFADGTRWVVRANQEACPTDWTSLAGGACTVECRWLDTAGKPGQYVDPVSGACRACSQPVCVLGEVLEPCTPTSDARCQRCELYRDAVCADCPADPGSNDTCIQCDISSVQVTESTGIFLDVENSTVFQFTSSGTIYFTSDTLVDVLVIGGGGNGNDHYGGGGGGAGTVIFAPSTLLRGGKTYSVIVGSGGQPSAIGNVFVASAGGNGSPWFNWKGGTGGSVGGTSTVFGVMGIYSNENAFAAKAGAPGDYLAPQYYGGAGGGAGGPGLGGQCGAGGLGISQANISGVVYVFLDRFGQAYSSIAVNGFVAEGGTGGFYSPINSAICPDTGLGGFGGSRRAGSGKANTGSGGGGGYYYVSGGGGSGLVLIRKQGRGNLRSSTDPRDTRYCNVCRKRAVLTYSVLGTCEASTLSEMAPCRAGWYLGGGGFCVRCPQFTATLFDGATRVEQCKCLDGMVRRGPGECVADGPYERFDDDACVDGTCRLPRNARARLDDAETCGWACNAGFYRDSQAGFLDQCRPCLGGSGRTRGDDGEPWSCE